MIAVRVMISHSSDTLNPSRCSYLAFTFQHVAGTGVDRKPESQREELLLAKCKEVLR